MPLTLISLPLFQAFVGVVRRNVSTIEDVVVKAESDVGSVSSVKKMLQMFKLPLFGTSVSSKLTLLDLLYIYIVTSGMC